MLMKIKEALANEEVSYRDFYSALQDAGLGYWDGINSTDIIREYVSEMMKQGIHVSHILSALESEISETEDWSIWLGNSMNTPTPINSKQELLDALELDGEELEMKLEF